MSKTAFIAIFLCLLFCFAGCGTGQGTENYGNTEASESARQESGGENSVQANQSTSEPFTVDTEILEVIHYPAFGEYGRLIFPVDSSYYSGDTLGDLRMIWYNNIDQNETVKIANYMKDRAEAGDAVFYDIYTVDEKAADPEKENTGLFFFKGNPGARFAVCSAGGGFAYGVYAFAKRSIPSYLFLQAQFVFFDFEEPLILFFLDYLAAMGLFVWIGHYLAKAALHFQKGKAKG